MSIAFEVGWYVIDGLCGDRQPIPVNLQKKDVKAELERAVSSTYMHQNQGTCTYDPNSSPHP